MTEFVERPIHPAVDDGEALANSTQVRAMLGGVSDMFLHRHSKDPNPETRFPAPDVVISNRRYWYLRTIRGWRDAQSKSRTRAPIELAPPGEKMEAT